MKMQLGLKMRTFAGIKKFYNFIILESENAEEELNSIVIILNLIFFIFFPL